MCTDTIKVLAAGVQGTMNPTKYGRLRSKLDKQGFSEIAIFTAIAKHCVENDIAPKTMITDTVNYLIGCSNNAFHPKTSNECHFLRGQFFQLRHGNPDRGEPKSPEQKDQFLCNNCHEVKAGKLRCRNKNEKHTCTICKTAKSKAYNTRRAEDLKAKKNAEKRSQEPASPAIPTELIKSMSTTESGFKHEEASSQLAAELSKIPERPQWEPQPIKAKEPEPVQEEPIPEPEPEPTPEPIPEVEPEIIEEPVVEAEPEIQEEEKPMTETVKELPVNANKEERKKLGVEVKVTEVMADAEQATISLQCPTEHLHLVLSAIKTL